MLPGCKVSPSVSGGGPCSHRGPEGACSPGLVLGGQVFGAEEVTHTQPLPLLLGLLPRDQGSSQAPPVEDCCCPKPEALCQQTLGRRKDVSAPVTDPEVCVACPSRQKGNFGRDPRWPLVGSDSSPRATLCSPRSPAALQRASKRFLVGKPALAGSRALLVPGGSLLAIRLVPWAQPVRSHCCCRELPGSCELQSSPQTQRDGSKPGTASF